MFMTLPRKVRSILADDDSVELLDDTHEEKMKEVQKVVNKKIIGVAGMKGRTREKFKDRVRHAECGENEKRSGIEHVPIFANIDFVKYCSKICQIILSRDV